MGSKTGGWQFSGWTSGDVYSILLGRLGGLGRNICSFSFHSNAQVTCFSLRKWQHWCLIRWHLLDNITSSHFTKQMMWNKWSMCFMLTSDYTLKQRNVNGFHKDARGRWCQVLLTPQYVPSTTQTTWWESSGTVDVLYTVSPPRWIEVYQGGRTWQPFVGGKNGYENFRQEHIYNFCDKCVVFARNRKFANLTQ